MCAPKALCCKSVLTLSISPALEIMPMSLEGWEGQQAHQIQVGRHRDAVTEGMSLKPSVINKKYI